MCIQEYILAEVRCSTGDVIGLAWVAHVSKSFSALESTEYLPRYASVDPFGASSVLVNFRPILVYSLMFLFFHWRFIYINTFLFLRSTP